MKREQLEQLGLKKDVIDQIMQENGADIENARSAERQSFAGERQQLQGQITDLQGQIEARDADLVTLNGQLTAVQADAGKLTEAQGALAALQTKYNTDRQEWEQKIARQAYEHAVQTKAGELAFTSVAAKKEFVREAIAQGFKLDGDSLLGYSDFLAKYRETDPGAFVVETPVDPQADPPARIVAPGAPAAPKHQLTLSEVMALKNENPKMEINFDK